MAVSSTENAKCGVLTPASDQPLKHRFRPCCTAQDRLRAHNSLFGHQFSPQRRLGAGRRPHRRLAGRRRRRQHPGRPVQRQYVGRGVLGEDPGRTRQEQSRCRQAEPADARHADPARHEEEARRRCLGRPSLQRQGRPDLFFDHQACRRRSARDSGLRVRLPVRRRDLDPRRPADSLEPRQQHGQGRGEGCRAAAGGKTRRPGPEDHGLDGACAEAGGRPAQGHVGELPIGESRDDASLLADLARLAHQRRLEQQHRRERGDQR